MKKAVALVLVAAFAMTVGAAFAATEKCTVDTVEGDTVTMTCKDTKLTPGTKVKVKAEKKIEGC